MKVTNKAILTKKKILPIQNWARQFRIEKAI